MIKHYIYHGTEWKFEESIAPTGAVELGSVVKKAKKPVANKSAKVKNKTKETKK